MDALVALTKCRPVFGNGSERNHLLSGLHQRLAQDVTLKWLEVGIGDGENLKYLLDQLGEARSFKITAVDPSPDSVERLASRHPITVKRKPIESFKTTVKYDCINVRQSAYYFDDPPTMFLRLCRLLSCGGVLVATIWSEQCVLRKLNGLIAHSLGLSQVALRSEDLVSRLPSEDFLVERHIQDCGSVNFAQLKAEREVLIALCALAARKLDIRKLSEDQLDYMLCKLERLERYGSRRENEIIFVSRRI